ncbi:unnamed protein product [Darwinula stevensoni]|uniref:Uncharacterized protein n=1 Tax=Darwinula stevensoni TaxID=69355 RepID=A0A7R8X266_9CRUS|nr:unnamed protein product [Darwinula stevensoni]CAG0882970.1 unnamed protein product [Darwinula stevensoni]
MGPQAHITCLLLLGLFHWSSEQGDCNRTFTGWGTFSSPNYPNNYYDDYFCWYDIRAPTDGWVYLEFLEFDLEWSYACEDDSLEMVGHGDHWTDIKCGAFQPFETQWDAIHIFLKFKTNNLITRRGFSVTYVTVVPECEEGWEEFQYGCYYFTNERKTALEALMECEDVGANLASIHDDAEYIFISAHAPSSPFWIGLKTQGSLHEWIDGTSYEYEVPNLNFFDDGFTYTWTDKWVNENCTSNEPVSHSRSLGENCAYATFDARGDLHSNERFPFVCKKDRLKSILRGN